jgi:hypothetical protein
MERMADDIQMGDNSREIEKRLLERKIEDLTIPHQCDAAYIYYPAGADLEQIESFTTELTDIVDKMKEELVKETRILEGTEVPVYQENELSISKPVEEQWKNDLPSGSLITGLTLISTPDSSSSSCIAEDSSPNFRTPPLRRQSTTSPISSCSETSDDCGIVTDAMNESSECTVPMISELMLGMPNEAKWLQPLKYMESSVLSLPVEK